jgi:hypothetical protein
VKIEKSRRVVESRPVQGRILTDASDANASVKIEKSC